MKRGACLLVGVLLLSAGTAGAVSQTSGTFAGGSTAAGMAGGVAGAWSVDDFVCDNSAGTSLDICSYTCAGFNDCSTCSGPTEVVTLGFDVPGDGQLDAAHDYTLLVENNPLSGNIECIWGTAPDNTIGAVPRQQLESGTVDSCERLRCIGGNDGTICVTDGVCGGGTCSGVCSDDTSVNCGLQTDCAGIGACVPPGPTCVGGSNPGAICPNGTECTGGGSCSPVTADCQVISSHTPTRSWNVPTLGQWTYMLVGLLMLSGAWVLWRTLAA